MKSLQIFRCYLTRRYRSSSCPGKRRIYVLEECCTVQCPKNKETSTVNVIKTFVTGVLNKWPWV